MTYREEEIATTASRFVKCEADVDIEVRIAAHRSAAEILQQSLMMRALQAAVARTFV